MTWPADPLPVAVEMWTGSWQDITNKVFARDGGITIRRGFPDEGSTPEPSECTLTLDNRTGDFTPRNPMGQYYGKIGRNTPVRVSVALYEDDFDRAAVADGWGDDWTLVTTGGAAGDFDVAAGVGTVVVDGANEARAAYLTSRSFADIEVRATVDIADTNITGAAVGGGPILRVTDASNLYWCNASVGTDEAVTLTIFDRTAGSNTQLATGSAGITWDGTPLVVAFSAHGETLKAKVWLSDENEPGDWLLETTDTTHTSGSAGVRVATLSGNTDTPVTFSVDDFAVRTYRFHGEVSEWPVRWDVSEQDVRTSITAQGILRRLGQGKLGKPMRSALTRYLAENALVAWSLETEKGRTSWPELVDGKSAFRVTPTHKSWQVDDAVFSVTPGPLDAPGLEANGARMSGGSLQAHFPVIASDGTVGLALPDEITVCWVARLDLVPGLTISDTETAWWSVNLMEVHPDRGSTPDESGTSIFSAYADDRGVCSMGLLDANVIAPAVSDEFAAFGDSTVLYMLQLDDDGAGNTDWSLTAVPLDADVDSLELGSGTRAASLTDTAVGIWITLVGTTISHYAVLSGLVDLTDYFRGYIGETAAERFDRLADEEGITAAVVGAAADTQAMGPQPVGTTLMDAIDETWKVDMALLYESRHELGLTFRTRRSLYNQAVALTLDYTGPGEIAPDLAPTDDDLYTRNDITVRRRDGGSARAVDTTSRMCTADPPAGVGLVAEELELNLGPDVGLDDVAHWLLHVHTWDEPRVRAVNIYLHALAAAGKHEQVTQAAQIDVGDRFQLTNLPAHSGFVGTADLMVLGFEERIEHPVAWTITLV